MFRSIRKRNLATVAAALTVTQFDFTRRLRLEGLEVREMLTGVAGALSSAAASIRVFSASSLTTNTRPAAPSLVATAVSVSQINLSWNPVSGASGYLVDELINGGWSQIGSLGSGVSGYTVAGLSAGTTYSFEVAAYNSAGTSWANSQTRHDRAAARWTIPRRRPPTPPSAARCSAPTGRPTWTCSRGTWATAG